MTNKLILFFLMVFTSNIYAGETWKIASLNWQPYAGSEIENQGSSIHKLRELLKKEDITLIIEFYPWNRAKELVKNNKEYVGIFPAWPEDVFDGSIISPAVDWSKISILKRSKNVVIFESIDELFETQAFAIAIEETLAKVDLNETLILVTADHSHPLTMVGYPKRGNPILGNVKPAGIKGGAKVIDGLAVDSNGNPYTTLGYRVGPKNKADTVRLANGSMAKNYNQQTAIPMASGFHGGEDVALYATGPQSHLVGGVLEQNVIFHIITQALGWNGKEPN